MLIIINDNKRASGKTTLARKIIGDKKYVQMASMCPFLGPFAPFIESPDFILIDGASCHDIKLANKIAQEENMEYPVRLLKTTVFLKTPNFILITDEELQIKVN